MMKEHEEDTFDILGISTREDSFTDLLKSIYDNSLIFKTGLCKRVFGIEGDNKQFDDYEMIVRRAFKASKESGRRNNIVPDIIIKSDKEKELAIIEVKLFSGEGIDQTQDYFNDATFILKEIGLPESVLNEIKYYFLTLFGVDAAAKDIECKNAFEPMSWCDLISLIPEGDKESFGGNEVVAQLAKELKMRGREFNDAFNCKINIHDDWNSVVKTRGWAAASIPLYRLFKQELFEKKSSYYVNNTYWSAYTQSTNKYQHKAQFAKKEWLSETVVDDLEKNKKFSQCYDLHYEFEWQESEKSLTIRLDYHLNPYTAGRLVEKDSAAEKANIKRQGFALKVREKYKSDDQFKRNGVIFNSRITKRVMQIACKQIYCEGKSVQEVIEEIKKFVDITEPLIYEIIMMSENDGAIQ